MLHATHLLEITHSRSPWTSAVLGPKMREMKSLKNMFSTKKNRRVALKFIVGRQINAE